MVHFVYLLNHLYWVSFHFRTLSMMIRLAVQTTQKLKKIKEGLKIERENKIKSCMIYPVS